MKRPTPGQGQISESCSRLRGKGNRRLIDGWCFGCSEVDAVPVWHVEQRAEHKDEALDLLVDLRPQIRLLPP